MSTGASLHSRLFILCAIGLCTNSIAGNQLPDGKSDCRDLFAQVRTQHSVDPKGWRNAYQQKAYELGLSAEDGLGQALKKKPSARLIAIGEEHGDPNHHLDTIRKIRTERPDVDTIFIEVAVHYNSLFEAFHKGDIEKDVLMAEIARSSQAKNHITEPLVSLSKELGLKIVGVERVSDGAATFSGMLDLGSRNPYSANIMSKYLLRGNQAGTFPLDRLCRVGNCEAPPRSNAGIYIGGSGHVHWRGDNFDSVTDIVQQDGFEVLKILSVTSSSENWDLNRIASNQGFESPNVERTFSFLPWGETPLMLPALPIVNTHDVTYSDYDLVIIRP